MGASQDKVFRKQRASMLDTLNAMRAAAQQGKKDMAVRRQVEEITKGIAQGDYSSEVLAIYYWVCRNIRYLRDINGVEYLQIPRKTLESRTGDCDDMATLLAAMLMAAGNPVNFAIASFKRGKPSFSHVYVEVITPHGPISIDPVANRETVKMLRTMKHKVSIPVSKGAGQPDAGIGALGSPPRHMGANGGNLYSVYDYHRGNFEYFEAPTGALPATGRYRRPTATAGFGVAPEDVAAPLPDGAQKVGEGLEPKGIIASKNNDGGNLSLPSMRTVLLVAAGVGIGLWWSKRP